MKGEQRVCNVCGTSWNYDTGPNHQNWYCPMQKENNCSGWTVVNKYSDEKAHNIFGSENKQTNSSFNEDGGSGTFTIYIVAFIILIIGFIYISDFLTDAFSFTKNLITENIVYINIYSFIILLWTLIFTIRNFNSLKTSLINESSNLIIVTYNFCKFLVKLYLVNFFLPMLFLFKIIWFCIILFFGFLVLAIGSEKFGIIENFTVETYFKFLDKYEKLFYSLFN